MNEVNTPKLAIAMNYIDDDLISGAIEYKPITKKIKNTWFRHAIVAACLCLMLIAFPVIQNLTSTQEADTIEFAEVIEWPEERVEKKLIGEYRENILHSWGEPDITLTDTNADKYYLDEDNSRYIILYYDNEGYITEFTFGED